MKFMIGDKVKVRPYDKLPKDIKNKGLGKSAGKEGEIVDIMYSNAKECYTYRLHFEDSDRPSTTDFPEGSFDLLSELEQAAYTYEFEYAENLVIARLYEIKGDSKKMIARGHGHIFHDGALGIAQAASYALMRIYRHVNGEEED